MDDDWWWWVGIAVLSDAVNRVAQSWRGRFPCVKCSARVSTNFPYMGAVCSIQSNAARPSEQFSTHSARSVNSWHCVMYVMASDNLVINHFIAALMR